MTDDQTIQDVKAVRACLEKGWTKNATQLVENVTRLNEHGNLVIEERNVRHCITGAINETIAGNHHTFRSGNEEDFVRQKELYRLFAEQLPHNPKVSRVGDAPHMTNARIIVEWNDEQQTTEQDVLNLCDKILADKGGL